MESRSRLIVTTLDDEPGVLVLAGELDPSTAPVLDAAIDAALARGAATLVINLAGVTFLDSSGLRSLISAHIRLGPEPLRLRGPSASARQLLTITGLDAHFVVEDSPPH